jgi:adenylate cyclase
MAHDSGRTPAPTAFPRRGELVTDAERREGKLADTHVVAVAFADLAGYTQLGAKIEPRELGSIASRLGEVVTTCLRRPVRLVKMVGDAAMLVSPDVVALLETLAEVRARVDEADRPMPAVRIGAAVGPATTRGGDWYGATVNVASRITQSAKPGQILVTEPVLDQADGHDFRRRRKLRLKGVDARVRVFELVASQDG